LKAEQEQKDHDQAIDQWAEDIAAQVEEVTFFSPGIMQHYQWRDQIDQAVQPRPIFAQPFHPILERGDRQGKQQQEREHAYQDETLLEDGVPYQWPA
jgi:predicted component of type VI protein secretion system